MFHHVSNASKMAFYQLTEFLKTNNFELIDAQQETSHLKSLGAYPVDRNYFFNTVKKNFSVLLPLKVIGEMEKPVIKS